MGNCCIVEGAIDHWIYVKSGDKKGSVVDVNLRAILYDDKGNQSQEIHLDCYLRNDFERGKTDVIQCPALGHNFGQVVMVELWRDDPGMAPNWFCELVVVNDRRVDKCFYFPVLRWMRPQQRYKIEEFDTKLPQFDQNYEQRAEELKARRRDYQFGQQAPGMPVQVRSLFTFTGLLFPYSIFTLIQVASPPADEQFSDDNKVIIACCS